jgi:hypothetical protein
MTKHVAVALMMPGLAVAPLSADILDAQPTGFSLKYGGYMAGGLARFAPVVDRVYAQQVERLKTYAETGRPE